MDTNKIPGQAEGDSLARSGGSTVGSGGGSKDPWMTLAQDAYKRSTTYFDDNYRKDWEDGLRLFNSQHPRDSKYNSDAYRYRSRIFRPKTRSVIRKHEATAAMALFSNPDVVSLDPINDQDEKQIYSAQVNKELLQYRLSGPRVGIPWFLISLGAFQDAMTLGVCASFQYWDYQATPQKVKVGELEVEVPKVKVDKPVCDLISINNLRFDPAAKWYDVVGTSPYIILEMPMYLRDVLDRMEQEGGKGQPAWKKFDKKVILASKVTDYDPVQQARDGKKEDPKLVTSEVNEFDVIMVHLNFMRTDDGEFVYFTLKDKELLSDPIPLDEFVLHGERPITIGFCVLETHKPIPKGLTILGSQLQQETNEVANQRLDNVKLVLNKRWVVRRGSNIDVESMLRNVPGGVTMANDTEKDVREINWADVTSSSFQEQDRLNADFDDLEGGGMSSSSVSTNRRMNETVGGMRLLAQGSNALTEYTLRLWVETWVEPTLRQLVKLEQKYESNETIIGIAAQRTPLYQKYGQSTDLNDLLDHEMTVSVNVGMGATDPESRFQKFMQAAGAYTQVVQAAQVVGDMNLAEVRKELFGLAGFKDSKRFFMPQVDPRQMIAQKMMQGAQQQAMQLIDQHKDRIQRRERALDMREIQVQMQEQEAQRGQQELANELQLELQRFQQEAQIDWAKAQQQMGIDMRKASLESQLQWMKAHQEARLKEFQSRVDAKVKMHLAAKQGAAKFKEPAGE